MPFSLYPTQQARAQSSASAASAARPLPLLARGNGVSSALLSGASPCAAVTAAASLRPLPAGRGPVLMRAAATEAASGSETFTYQAEVRGRALGSGVCVGRLCGQRGARAGVWEWECWPGRCGTTQLQFVCAHGTWEHRPGNWLVRGGVDV